MNIRDVYSAKNIALVQTQVASNKIAYLGAGLFPAKKKINAYQRIRRTGNYACSGQHRSICNGSFKQNF